jgi:hypothetical protein
MLPNAVQHPQRVSQESLACVILHRVPHLSWSFHE